MLKEKCQQTKRPQKLESERPEEVCHHWLNGFMGVMMNLVNTLLKLPSLGPGSRVKKRKIPIVGLQIFGYTSQSTLRIQNTKSKIQNQAIKGFFMYNSHFREGGKGPL